METWLWSALGFLLGSLPFSVWVGHALLHKDITQLGDANPGATNVLRAGGRWTVALALGLDAGKGALPVGLAHLTAGIDDWRLVPIALAPILGHAFSPWLGFKGGKAMAVSLGVWIGLTVWEIPTIGGLLLLLFTRLVGANGWAVLLMCLSLLPYLLLAPPAWNLLGVRPEPFVSAAILIGNATVLTYKYRSDLVRPPAIRWRRQKHSTP